MLIRCKEAVLEGTVNFFNVQYKGLSLVAPWLKEISQTRYTIVSIGDQLRTCGLLKSYAKRPTREGNPMISSATS